MAGSLPDSIGVAALQRYDEFVVMIEPDKVADTQQLYNHLTSGENAGMVERNNLEQVRVDKAFVDLLEHFGSEDTDRGRPVFTQTVLAVWAAMLNHQLSAQRAALAAAAATSMQTDDNEAAAATIPPAKAGFTAAKSGAFSLATAAIKRVSDMRLDLDADYNAQAKASCIRRILADLSLADDQKEKEIATLYKCWGTQPHAVSSFRSSSRSSPPESFHGLAKDHGQPAQPWLYSVELYFQAEYTPNPAAKAVTYLHGEARRWWQQVGSKILSSASTYEMFSQAFLARFVKPSDSAKARAEISLLKQTDSVESFASHFRNVNSRISVGSPIDTTTLANYFVHGLKSKLAKALAVHCTLATMQELDSVISAAEEMDAKLNLAAKQDQPGLAAVTGG